MNALGAWARGASGRSRGQSLVELAAILPLMMALIMGVIDFGWVLYAHVQVAAASYEGARAGALFPGDLTDTVTNNDADRQDVVRKAIYNSSVTPPTSALGMLSVGSPHFVVTGSDVTFSYGTHNLSNVVRRGEEMVVKVTYHQPVWFGLLPGTADGLFDVSTTTKVRIQ